MRPSGILPVLLLAGFAAAGAGQGTAQAQSGMPKSLFGRAFEPKRAEPAQSADAAFKVQQLEQEVRTLNGRIEDLNFQLLQMQEQLRKMQEDNEFRFQEIEEGRAGRKGDPKVARKREPVESLSAESQPSVAGLENPGAQRTNGDVIARVIEQDAAAPQPLPPPANAPRIIDGVQIYDGNSEQAAESGLRPETLGRLVFDQNGNVIDSDVEKPIDLTGQIGKAQPGSTVASLELPDSPDQLYDLGYNYIQAGDYALAEDAFETFSQRYPDHPRVADARFWVGESLLSRAMYQDAAKVLLDTHKKYPNGRMGPQTLLKLGVSLAGMNQRELACATFAEVGKQYPQASSAIRDKVVQEQKAASCKAG